MKNSITVQISEGLGNQLFMYAHAYSFSKLLDYTLLIDSKSGFFKKKNRLRGQRFLLDRFNVDLKNAPSHKIPDTFAKNNLNKLLIIFDFFKTKKSFLIEKFYKELNYNKDNFSNDIYIRGNFENENFFYPYRNDLVNLFSVKPKYLKNNSNIISKLKNSNSVSIHVRQNRFSDQNLKKNYLRNIKQSNLFLNNNLQYIDRSIEYLNSKFSDLNFFISSNDFIDLKKHFSKYKNNKFYYLENNDELNDFALFKYAKHFIVGPSTFHWWGAWLNNNTDKVCLCPKNINPSNNKNFWPPNWLKI
jgi:hypothetical protein